MNCPNCGAAVISNERLCQNCGAIVMPAGGTIPPIRKGSAVEQGSYLQEIYVDSGVFERVPTGIPGLDKMLHGGLISGSIALLQGAPGTGKTTVGMEFLHHGVMEEDEAGLLVTFEQFPHTLYRDALAHGWNLRELEQEGKLRVVFTSPQVFLDPGIGKSSSSSNRWMGKSIRSWFFL